jgi:hypothetical protein
MNKFLKPLLIAVLLTGCYTLHAQKINDMINKTLQKNGIHTGKNSKLTNTDIVQGLKEALQVGTQNSVRRLSAVDGYFGNPMIKILMPPEAKNVENVLRKMGLGSQVDEAIKSMNRAAEDAANRAIPIFLNAIMNMSIEDGLSILKGDKNAATNYLKAKTYNELEQKYHPEVAASLNKVNATKYWNEMFTTYNKIPMVEKVNPDLIGYVTERALNGLFVNIAEEEAKIRANPSARVTDLLKKVFGSGQ